MYVAKKIAESATHPSDLYVPQVTAGSTESNAEIMRSVRDALASFEVRMQYEFQ